MKQFKVTLVLNLVPSAVQSGLYWKRKNLVQAIKNKIVFLCICAYITTPVVFWGYTYVVKNCWLLLYCLLRSQQISKTAISADHCWILVLRSESITYTTVVHILRYRGTFLYIYVVVYCGGVAFLSSFSKKKVFASKHCYYS